MICRVYILDHDTTTDVYVVEVGRRASVEDDVALSLESTTPEGLAELYDGLRAWWAA